MFNLRILPSYLLSTHVGNAYVLSSVRRVNLCLLYQMHNVNILHFQLFILQIYTAKLQYLVTVNMLYVFPTRSTLWPVGAGGRMPVCAMTSCAASRHVHHTWTTTNPPSLTRHLSISIQTHDCHAMVGFMGDILHTVPALFIYRYSEVRQGAVLAFALFSFRFKI